MWDICMLKNESEALIFLLIIIAIFLHNILHLVVGHTLQPCSCCFNSYHHVSDCLAFRQFSNLSCEQMNTNFSNVGFDSNSNFYNPEWTNHSDFSW